MTNRPLTTPVINLNGDRAETLMVTSLAVVTALNTLIEAMRDASPHGRNFQCSPEGSYDAARAQFREHCNQLRSMESFYVEQYLDLQEQNEDRKNR